MKTAFLFIFALGATVVGLRAQPFEQGHVRAELVAAGQSIQAGEPFWAALRLDAEPGWHTYWVNPGDAGIVTTLEWLDPPSGFKGGAFVWPTPKLFEQSGLANYVYEGETFLWMKLTPPASLQPGDTLRLRGRADWLECDDHTCVPGGADVVLELPVSNEAPVPSRWRAALARARSVEWPRALPSDWQATALADGEAVTLTLEPHGVVADHDLGAVYFFSETGYIAPGESQHVERTSGGTWVITLAKEPYFDGEAQRLRGVVRAENGWLADGAPLGLSVNPVLSVPSPVSSVTGPVAGESPAAEGKSASALPKLLGLAFLGGLILNLMPCVFPVLGLKIMGFVNQAGEQRGKIVGHGLVYTLGVLVSFWVLSGVLLALRAGGEQLGWGFQLQSPGFVLALAVLLLVFALNLSGVFEIGHSAVGVGANLTAKSGLSGSFFSGVLATVVATPCAAPFLAPALGGALTLPPASSVLVFTVVGLGLAFPYLLLSIFPHWASRLPRPGAWMETFKQFMAFLLYATVAALVWVLAGQVEANTLLAVLFALVLTGMGAWVFGRWGAPHLPVGKRRVAWAVALALVIGPALYAWSMAQEEERRRAAVVAAQESGETLDFLVWEKWSPEAVKALLAAGRPVYIDFTARWCATCQVNKRVYDDPVLVREFHQRNVAPLKADWTNHDPAITRALEAFGRGAVPFNVLYVPGRETPVVLPELLTVANVQAALDEISQK